METLPDDVLVHIFSLTDLDTFLTLQQLSRKICSLVRTRNNGLTQAVARNTFPEQTRLFIEADGPAANRIGWLKDLRYRQLAAIMLECNPELPVPAEDAPGDRIREIVTYGWRVLAHFAAIARVVHQLEPEEVPLRGSSPPTSAGCANDKHADDVHRARELEVCVRRMAYVESLSYDELRGYNFLWRSLLPWTLGDEVFPHDGRDCSWTDSHRKAEDWIFSHIATQGPTLFWRVWWSHQATPPGKAIGLEQELLRAASSKSEAMREIEANGIMAVHSQIRQILYRVENILLRVGRRPQAPQVQALLAEDALYPISAQCTALHANGEQEQTRVLRAVPFEQRADWSVFEASMSFARSTMTRLRFPRDSSPKGRAPFDPMLMPDFELLYTEWEIDWMERKAWEAYRSILDGP